MKIRFLKCFVMRLLGVKRITEERLRSLGFVDHDDGRGLGVLVKHRVEVWCWNDKYWLVDVLDQAGVNKEFYYMHDLELFFTACGLDIKAA